MAEADAMKIVDTAEKLFEELLRHRLIEGSALRDVVEKFSATDQLLRDECDFNRLSSRLKLSGDHL